ncbi:hypothetical protein RIF29_13865 [Crotalaria pallida]|uniref:Uncharacterized protein n=1 Tax=Crotalaria pallida TaxID=3830 RepID=A0AAN9FCE6_CROPI
MMKEEEQLVADVGGTTTGSPLSSVTLNPTNREKIATHFLHRPCVYAVGLTRTTTFGRHRRTLPGDHGWGKQAQLSK